MGWPSVSLERQDAVIELDNLSDIRKDKNQVPHWVRALSIVPVGFRGALGQQPLVIFFFLDDVKSMVE